MQCTLVVLHSIDIEEEGAGKRDILFIFKKKIHSFPNWMTFIDIMFHIFFNSFVIVLHLMYGTTT